MRVTRMRYSTRYRGIGVDCRVLKNTYKMGATPINLSLRALLDAHLAPVTTPNVYYSFTHQVKIRITEEDQRSAECGSIHRLGRRSTLWREYECAQTGCAQTFREAQANRGEATARSLLEKGLFHL